MSRRIARETALKTLFQQEFQEITSDQALPISLEETEMTTNDFIFAKSLIAGVNEHRPQLDSTLNEFAVDWKMDRIARLERTILRMALYELMFLNDVPVGVTVNEAIEIAKIYSTQEASKFINGILGNVVQHMKFMGKKVNPNDSEIG